MKRRSTRQVGRLETAVRRAMGLHGLADLKLPSVSIYNGRSERGDFAADTENNIAQ